MDRKQLILTSTTGMNREQWLQFRQPLNHIKEFLDDHLRKAVNVNVSREVFWSQEYSSTLYPVLKDFFKTDAWKNFQFPCVGGSEVASIMGLNPYQSIIELYFEKCGVIAPYSGDNPAMFWGRELEQEIAEKWQYWDGNVDGMIDNFSKGNIIRRCRRINAYIQNTSFPWLFVSLDRVINKQYSGEQTIEEGSLEAKTISGWAAEQWESGIPVMYIAQLQAQLIACGFTFGEIAILKDGRNFDVFQFDRHDEICARIIEMTKQFSALVKAGASCFLLHLYAPDDHLKQQHYADLERLAPEADGSDAYKNYLSKKYEKTDGAEIIGTIVEEQLAMDYEYYSQKMKELDGFRTERANKLKGFMKEARRLTLGETGSCTWSDTKTGRMFRVNVTIPSDYVPNTFKTNPAKNMETKVLEFNGTEEEFKNQPRKNRKKKESVDKS